MLFRLLQDVCDTEILLEKTTCQQYQEAKAHLVGLNRVRGENLSKRNPAYRLYKFLSGSNHRQVSMDKYVLSIMLEEVLSCANRFLTRSAGTAIPCGAARGGLSTMPAAVWIGNCIEVSRLPDGSADAKGSSVQ